MPTPRPIIDTSSGVIVLMSVRPARRKSSMNARHDRDEREPDRDRRGDERAEDDEQHDERGQQAEQLLRPLLERREFGVAVELDGHARGLDSLAYRLLHGDDLLAVLLEDHAVELRLGVCDAAAVGERLVRERVTDAGDARLPSGRSRSAGTRRPGASGSPLRSRPGAPGCRAARPRARRTRGSGRRPAPRRTRTRSGRSRAACPSPGSRTRPSGFRRRRRRGR